MEIQTITQDQAVSILKLTGELDASNAILVDMEIQKAINPKPNQLWIDGTELTYISSAGLGVFISHFQTLQNENINLVFYGLNSKIRNIFYILGLQEVVKIVETKENAMAEFCRNSVNI